MAKTATPESKSKKSAFPGSAQKGSGGIAELWQAAVNLRGAIQPADYKPRTIFAAHEMRIRIEKRSQRLETSVFKGNSIPAARHRSTGASNICDRKPLFSF